MSTTVVENYLSRLRQTASAPNATEHSYRPAFEDLVRSLAAELNRPLAHFTLEPGRIPAAGAPDAVLYKGEDELIGYIETKDLGNDLDRLSGHDLNQFKRYREAFPAWIYTNYLEFILFENRRETLRVVMASKAQILGNANLRKLSETEGGRLAALFDQFLQQSIPVFATSSDLARILANKARLLEQALLALLNTQPPDEQLQSQFESYRKWLIPDLTIVGFADFYAQTLTYGLFFAAIENQQIVPRRPFARNNLLAMVPQSIRPVRAIFQLLAADFVPVALDWIIEDIMRTLDRADMSSVALQLGQGRDLSIHFYEVFLRQYDPALSARVGVYYTPDEVVHFIVASVDAVLRSEFGKLDGLAAPDVTLLDPALGTGTFLAQALRYVGQTFGSGHAGELVAHLRQHTLKQWFGFELLAAPYVLAHLKLSQVLESLGVADGVAQVYLTNTLSDHIFRACSITWDQAAAGRRATDWMVRCRMRSASAGRRPAREQRSRK